MAYIRLTAGKSNTINSYSVSSNQGANTAVAIFAKRNLRDGSREKSRGLFQFDYSDFIDAYASGVFPNDFSTVTATMTFFNMYSPVDFPSPNVDYGLYSLNEDWNPGTGDDITTAGFSNWNFPKETITANWNGASMTSRKIATFSSYDGDESITADAIPTLSGWYNTFGPFNDTENFGLCLQLEDLYESVTSTDYYQKLLFSSKTNSIFKPRIDIVWNDKFTDDFKDLYFGSTGTIYFYNKKRGVLSDLDGTNNFPGTFAISGIGVNAALTGSASSLSGMVISGVSGSRYATGLYQFKLPTIPYTYGNLTAFTAFWVITSSMSAVMSNIAKPVVLHSPIQDESLDFNVKFKMSIINFKDRIEVGEKFQWSIYFKKDSDILTSLTAGSTAINSYIALDGYWKLVDERTGVDVYPWQNINYNDTVNFINVDTKYLDQYRPYRLVVKLVEGDRVFYFDQPEYYYVFNAQ